MIYLYKGAIKHGSCCYAYLANLPTYLLLNNSPEHEVFVVIKLKDIINFGKKTKYLFTLC